MHKASQSLIIGATILLGWLPMLAITVLLGINLFSSTDALQWHPWQGAGLAVLFVFCLLSLWATTSVAFGLSMQFFIRFVLLSVGALTLMVLNGFGWLQWWVTPSQSTQGIWTLLALLWLFVAPLVVLAAHAVAHYRMLRRLLKTSQPTQG